MTHRKQQKK